MKTSARALLAAAWLAGAAPAAAQDAMPAAPAPSQPPRAAYPPPLQAAPPPAAYPPPPHAAPPPPATGEPTAAAPAAVPAPDAPPHAAPPPAAPGLPPAAAATTTPPASDRLPMRFAVQTEAAIGVYPGDFYNHLAGVRLDLVFSPHVSFGGYVGYANLKGKDGRASNVLPYAQVEYMLGPPGGVRFPLRFASGYLPRNGPVVRLSAGFAFPLTPKIDLVTELLVPTIWITRDQMLLSMDLAAELLFRL
jgi:hypothetical protein